MCDELSKDEICGDRWGGVNPNYEDENDSTEDEIDYFNDYYNEDITRCPQCGCKGMVNNDALTLLDILIFCCRRLSFANLLSFLIS